MLSCDDEFQRLWESTSYPNFLQKVPIAVEGTHILMESLFCKECRKLVSKKSRVYLHGKTFFVLSTKQMQRIQFTLVFCDTNNTVKCSFYRSCWLKNTGTTFYISSNFSKA